MGIVVDIENSYVKFDKPGEQTTFYPIVNKFFYDMQGFSIGFTFQFDAKRGVPPVPHSRELWQIGIVQNVLYDSLHFEYENGEVFAKEFSSPALDSDKYSRPFYSDPIRISLDKLKLKPEPGDDKTLVDVMVPVREFWYCSEGIGKLLDPWSNSGVHIDEEAQSVNIYDKPRRGAKMHRDLKSVITKAECIVALQAWLIAKNGSRVRVLAYVGPFSLIYWLRTEPRPDHLSIETPAHKWSCYSEKGIARRVVFHEGIKPARITGGAGAGGRNPVLDGETANDRDERWMKEKGIWPE
jgi:hypothetical protein